MSKQDFKKKRIVFDDTDIRHAQLKIRLQHDELTQAEFFRALISGYIDKDRHLINFINNYKEKKGITYIFFEHFRFHAFKFNADIFAIFAVDPELAAATDVK